jgi:hypothetical protein
LNWTQTLLRFMAVIVGIALGLRLVVELLRPVLPLLAVFAVLVSVAYIGWLIHRRRDRW